MATDPKQVTPPGERDTPTVLNRPPVLAKLSIAIPGGGAALVGIPVAGFLLAPLLRRTPEFWRPVGEVGKFKVGETVRVTFLDPSPLPWAGVTANTAAWLRRESEQDFVAFAVNCTHLGCP